MQETFLVALRRLQDLREPAAAGAWLHAIVRNVCRMRLRASRELQVPGEIAEQITAHHFEVDEALERLSLRDWLWTAIEDLPDDLRATLMLRYFTPHVAYVEIAAILGIPVGTVRSRLNQAKRRLADALLASAAATHCDHAALVETHWCWWQAVIDEAEREGSTVLYLADATREALVEAPALGYRAIGAEDQARGMVESITAGVRVHLTGIVASNGLTIMDGVYENPADDPHHCPPTHTEVRFHSKGQATRIVLYFGRDEESVSSPG